MLHLHLRAASRTRPTPARPLGALALPALLACFACLAAPAQAQLVTNGDFETADFTGWTLSGNAHYTTPNPDTFVFGNPHAGIYAAWLGPAGSDGFLSQSIATTAGHAYTVSYWLAVDTNSLSGLSSPNDFSASFGGQSLFSGTNLAATDSHSTAAADYVLYSFTTAAAAGPASTLRFGFRDDPAEFRLDDVQVRDAGPVPEASTTVSLGLLLALGIGGMAVAAKRKRARA